jgi:signal transduction histidine kinase
MALRLAIPALLLVVLCVLALVVAVSGPVGKAPWMTSGTPQQQALAEAAGLAAAATFVAIITVLLVAAYARRLSHEISDLTQAARTLANDQLPRVIKELHENPLTTSGTHATQSARRRLESQWLAAQPQHTKTAEIAAAVGAITSIERTAFNAAAAEVRLRDGLRQILMSLGRRNQSLLHRQLKIIDHLEQQAVSPGELADLFSLDHLTTRMRRHAESLTILSGASPVRSWSAPVPVIDVIRAAVAEIEDYKRIVVATEAEEHIAATAVTDMIHMLAELIENAALFSPSATRVEVRAERVANGFAIEIEDRGLGIAAEQLRDINERLASPPDFDLADADRLGLFVAGRLAARHDVQVELIPSAYRGTRAVVVLPEVLITTSAGQVGADSVLRAAPRLNVQSPEALSLVGALASRTAGATEPAAGGLAGAEPAGSSLLTDTPPAGLSALGRGELPERRERPGSSQVTGPMDRQGSGTAAEEEAPSKRAALPQRDRLARTDEARRPLPRRVRPGSPEQLASGTPVRMPGAVRPAEAPVPEHARNLAASLQTSWQRTREEDTPNTDLGAPTEAPDSEEKLWLTAKDSLGPTRPTSPGSLMTWPPESMTSAGRCCCPGTACSSPPRRTCPGRTRSTCRRSPLRSSPWPRAPGSGSTREGSGRRSSSLKRGCSSSRPRAREAAWPRSARPTRTPASLPTRWRCWSSAPVRTSCSRTGSRHGRPRRSDHGATRRKLEASRFGSRCPSLRGDRRQDRTRRR